MSQTAPPGAPDASELLAHTDWLHQLARALVGDAAADDVVQETYEVALAKPPRRDGPLRPWLGGVARNLARMSRRSGGRREQREHAAIAIADTDVPSPEELVARVEMQQKVARLVLELAEPLRATLLLRYFEGLTAAEIARAQQVPAATVRGRLKDALDRVRAALDAHHGGDRRRWAVLLAPLPAAAKSAATSTLLGGLLVKTSVKIALAVAAVLVAVLATRWMGWWGGAKSDDTVAQGSGSGAAPARVPVAATIATSHAPVTSRGIVPVHDDDPVGTLRLEGQVIDEHDRPVGGARVAIDAYPPRTVETEADGGFTFEGLIPRDYRLEATAGDGYAGPARLRLGAKPEPVTLRLRRGGVVEVAVTSASGGAPVAGATVELRSTLVWQGTTDASGTAKLVGVGAVWAPLAVHATGFAPAAIMVSTSGDPERPATYALALATGAPVAGRVVDEQGRPVEGARVVATFASEPFPVVDPRRDGTLTDAKGAWTLPALSAGTWRVTATHGDHAPASSPPLTLDGTNAREGVELVLGEGGTVRGVVRDKGGQPVAGADVRVVVRGFTFWRARRQALTGADGKFAMTGLPRRAVDVVASHETGGASAIAGADLAAKVEADVALTLDVTGAIDGIVADKAGATIGDAQVIAEPQFDGGVADRAAWGIRGVPETVTDQGGAFRFHGLPPGVYHVRAARPGAPEAALLLSPAAVARPGDAPLKLVVPADGKLAGKLAFADGATPKRFAIAIGSTDPRPFASADGKFELPAVAGTHMITVSGPGFVEKRVSDVVVAEGKPTDLGTITVTAGRSLSGRVLDENGVPVAKAKVAAGALLTGGGKELYIPNESIGAKDTETDADGRFSFAGFGSGPLTVVAGIDERRTASARIPSGPDSATLDLILQKTTGLDGKVTQSGAPLADTIVIANPIGATSSNFFVQTGPDGTFALDALAPSSYVVSAMLGGGGNRPKDMFMRRVDVVHGTRSRVEIDATLGPITLAVRVREGARPPAMAGVFAVSADIDIKTMEDMMDGSRANEMGYGALTIHTRGAPGGAVEIAGMRPGLHTVCATIMTLPPPDDRSTLPVGCAKIKLDAGKPKDAIDVVVQPKK
ncbi:MAG: sigma-70 family RNA polymerase sigma factor [Deltaproteobacteria bacterium]|nr:sigma-70 family RNA polymerase sigma factor [Deltaproteobacteria bacterium]